MDVLRSRRAVVRQFFSEGRFPTACKHEINLCFERKIKLAIDLTFTGLFRIVLPLFYHYSWQVCLMWFLCGLYHLLIMLSEKSGFENDIRKTKLLQIFYGTLCFMNWKTRVIYV